MKKQKAISAVEKKNIFTQIENVKVVTKPNGAQEFICPEDFTGKIFTEFYERNKIAIEKLKPQPRKSNAKKKRGESFKKVAPIILITLGEHLKSIDKEEIFTTALFGRLSFALNAEHEFICDLHGTKKHIETQVRNLVKFSGADFGGKRLFFLKTKYGWKLKAAHAKKEFFSIVIQ